MSTTIAANPRIITMNSVNRTMTWPRSPSRRPSPGAFAWPNGARHHSIRIRTVEDIGIWFPMASGQIIW